MASSRIDQPGTVENRRGSAARPGALVSNEFPTRMVLTGAPSDAVLSIIGRVFLDALTRFDAHQRDDG